MNQVLQSPSGSVLIANFSSPEIDRLAAELCVRRQLACYVRRYANKGRWWERLAENLPGLSTAYRRTLGRRALPRGLDATQVHEAGVCRDWAFVLAGRIPKSLLSGSGAADFKQALICQTELDISRAAARRMRADLSALVCSYGTAIEPFRQAVQGMRKVLNYPIAHHGFQFEFYKEEAELAPSFKGMLPQFHWPDGYQARLEEEIERADVILTGSRFAKDSFLSQGIPASKLVAAPYGVDVQRFNPGPRPSLGGVFRVIYVGQLGQRKGISYLLDGYRMFKKRDSELVIVGGVVGDGEGLKAYRDDFIYKPFVPQVELAEIYRNASVFVFPTLVEGMGMVAVEAMACGIPVITTDRGPDDIVRDGIDGFVVPIRSPEAIAERLEQLYHDRQLLQAMSAAAIERAQAFTWDRYTQQVADVVNKAEA